MTIATPTIHKGLAGVVVDTTAISKVVPETNSLTYRGYPVQDLAVQCSFEQVAYLLWHGELPNDGELALFNQRERAQRRLDRSLMALLAKLPETCHPMDVVRTAISYLGAEDPPRTTAHRMPTMPSHFVCSQCSRPSSRPICAAVVGLTRFSHTAIWAIRPTSCGCALAKSQIRSSSKPSSNP